MMARMHAWTCAIKGNDFLGGGAGTEYFFREIYVGEGAWTLGAASSCESWTPSARTGRTRASRKSSVSPLLFFSKIDCTYSNTTHVCLTSCPLRKFFCILMNNRFNIFLPQCRCFSVFSPSSLTKQDSKQALSPQKWKRVLQYLRKKVKIGTTFRNHPVEVSSVPP